MAKYLKVGNEFYKIESINNNIVKCFQYDGMNEDLSMKKIYFEFDLKNNDYELWN